MRGHWTNRCVSPDEKQQDMSLSISNNGSASITVSVEVNGTTYSGLHRRGVGGWGAFILVIKKHSFNHNNGMMFLSFFQEPFLPKSLLELRGPLWRLLLSQPLLLEPAQASVSLHHRFRPWAPLPPPHPPPRLLAQLSRLPAGRPNPRFPLYPLPRPRFLQQAPAWKYNTKRNQVE